jgi:transcriptional regulator GlxA family with amidase domain
MPGGSWSGLDGTVAGSSSQLADLATALRYISAMTEQGVWRIDILAYDGCFGLEVFGLTDIFAIANTVSKALRPGTCAPFKARVVSVRGLRVRLAGGVNVETHRAGGTGADQVIVPGFDFTDVAELDGLLAGWAPEVRFLRGLGSIELASVCVGAFLLGEAGILDGHEATTAWMFAPELSRRYPKTHLRADATVVEDGRITTAAAFSAGLDAALRIIGRHAGPDVARTTSRLALIPERRSCQNAFSDEKSDAVAHARFSDDVRNWLRHRLAEPYELSRLAGEFSVSTRTLLRRFSAETGESPLSYLRRTRVATAQRLLETSELSVHTILTHVGYQDMATFRRLFTHHVGMTPSDYRKAFHRTSTVDGRPAPLPRPRRSPSPNSVGRIDNHRSRL